MNLLAAGAAFGVVIAVFQFGWGLDILNLGQPGPLNPSYRSSCIAILFGLSMDYEAFLASRIREEWVAFTHCPRSPVIQVIHLLG